MNSACQILLVEDNPRDLELTLRVLRKVGLEAHVRIARDGPEAIAALEVPPVGYNTVPTLPRLILLDLKLPKADGLEVLRTLKGNPRTQAIPVVVLTTSREPHDLLAAYRAGANSYLVKPVNYEDFETTVGLTARYWLDLNILPRTE